MVDFYYFLVKFIEKKRNGGKKPEKDKKELT